MMALRLHLRAQNRQGNRQLQFKRRVLRDRNTTLGCFSDKQIISQHILKEELKHTKGVIRNNKSMSRRYNGHNILKE